MGPITTMFYIRSDCKNDTKIPSVIFKVTVIAVRGVTVISVNCDLLIFQNLTAISVIGRFTAITLLL